MAPSRWITRWCPLRIFTFKLEYNTGMWNSSEVCSRSFGPEFSLLIWSREHETRDDQLSVGMKPFSWNHSLRINEFEIQKTIISFDQIFLFATVSTLNHNRRSVRNLKNLTKALEFPAFLCYATQWRMHLRNWLKSNLCSRDYDSFWLEH